MTSNITVRFIQCYEELKSQNRVRSARQFALSLDYHPQSWNEILKGRRDVTLNLVERAVQEHSFNPMYLYTGDGPYMQTGASDGNQRVLTIVTDRVGKENILHVPTKAQAGYAAEAGPLEDINQLMTYSLPGMEHRFGTFRSFEIEGESMMPTVCPGEVVICRYVQPDFWEKQIQDDKVYVVVSREDLVIKRIKNRLSDHGAIHLHSDNDSFEPYLMPKTAIQELWYVEKVIRPFDQNDTPPQVDKSSDDLLELVRLQTSLIQELKSRSYAQS